MLRLVTYVGVEGWVKEAGTIAGIGKSISGYPRTILSANHFVTRRRSPNCILGPSFVGFRPQTLAGFPSNPACFHTSCQCSGKASDILKSHTQRLYEAPYPALALGLSGLIPFVVPAVYTAATLSIQTNILWAQAAYGASILSFLGGVRWGFALTDRQGVGPTWRSLGYSVMPSLVAWLGLLMPTLQPTQLCVVMGLLMTLIADKNFKAYPEWFRSMRTILSLIALLSLGVSYGFCLVYEPTSTKHGSNAWKLIKIIQIILED